MTGFVFKTRTGEVSVHVREYALLAKALRPMPFGKVYETEEGEEKQSGAPKDPELRYRQRYVDLNVNKASRERLVNRIKVVRAMREYLDGQDYSGGGDAGAAIRRRRRGGAALPDPPQRLQH